MAKSSSKKFKAQGKRGKLLENLEQRKLLASPLVITHGGTYTGEWESLDASVAALSPSRPSEPVIIENSTVRGPRRPDSSAARTTRDITVRNVKAYGLNPNVAGKVAAQFVDVSASTTSSSKTAYMDTPPASTR
jgi:hypothetical protein